MSLSHTVLNGFIPLAVKFSMYRIEKMPQSNLARKKREEKWDHKNQMKLLPKTDVKLRIGTNEKRMENTMLLTAAGSLVDWTAQMCQDHASMVYFIWPEFWSLLSAMSISLVPQHWFEKHRKRRSEITYVLDPIPDCNKASQGCWHS